MVDPRWYETFFRGLALELWRTAMTPEATAAEAAFAESALLLGAGARVLDVPCGNGRLALELAARGYRPYGIDLCAEFIEEARAAGERLGRTVEWRCADMRDIGERGVYDAACCVGNSFGYLDDGGNRAFVAAVAEALRPGGRFLLDTGMAAESILPELEGQRWWRVDDLLLLVRNDYDCDEGRLETEYTFVREGAVETARASHAVYTVAELQRMLAEVGLETRELHGSLEREPFRLASPRLLLVAEKT
jgi:SAM-dependent methyltransferase